MALRENSSLKQDYHRHKNTDCICLLMKPCRSSEDINDYKSIPLKTI